MKHSTAILFPNDTVAERVFTYSANSTTGIPEWLKEYHSAVVKKEDTSNYMISTFQAQAMNWLGRLNGTKRVLEIGVYVGFSAMAWAECVGPEGKVTGLEFSPGYAGKAREAFKKYGVKNVEIVDGDAMNTLSSLNPSEPYDLIFLDANKSGYPTYLRTILSRSRPGSSSRLLRAGGLIVADNVLRRGLVADDSPDNPHLATQQVDRSEYSQDTDLVCIREFNKMMVEEERLDAFLMPLWDGLGFAYLRD